MKRDTDIDLHATKTPEVNDAKFDGSFALLQARDNKTLSTLLHTRSLLLCTMDWRGIQDQVVKKAFDHPSVKKGQYTFWENVQAFYHAISTCRGWWLAVCACGCQLVCDLRLESVAVDALCPCSTVKQTGRSPC